MESSYRKVALASIMCILLTACTVERPVQSNPGFDEFNASMQANETNVSVVVEQEQGRFDKIKNNNFLQTIWSVANKAVKGVFGDKGWYVVGIVLLLIIIFSFFGKIGAVIFFIVVAYAIMKVLT